MTRSMILMAAVAFVAMSTTPAQSQMVCGERVEIVKALESGHQEQKTAAGLSGNGGLVELFTAVEGSWTLLLTVPGGPTCLLGSGEDWEGWKSTGQPKGQQSSAQPKLPADAT